MNTLSLCRYKDIFGKPNTGLHSYRLFGIAIIDVIFTILFAYILNVVLKEIFDVNLKVLHVILALFVIGEIMHILFCVSTPITRLIV